MAAARFRAAFVCIVLLHESVGTYRRGHAISWMCDWLGWW
jgi:hypothetical protein